MRKLSLITIVGALLAMSGAVAAAGAASPTLTRTEYRALLSVQAAGSIRSVKTVADVQRAQRACRDMSAVSAFMRADRADCNATYGWLEASVKALLRVKACAHRTTVDSRFACLTPSYARLGSTVRTMYHAEQRAYRAVVARGFTGACRRALSDGPKAIAHEGQMTIDISHMVSAMRSRSVLAAQKWGSLYDAATAEAEAAAPKVSVIVCPHQ